MPTLNTVTVALVVLLNASVAVAGQRAQGRVPTAPHQRAAGAPAVRSVPRAVVPVGPYRGAYRAPYYYGHSYYAVPYGYPGWAVLVGVGGVGVSVGYPAPYPYPYQPYPYPYGYPAVAVGATIGGVRIGVQYP